MEKIIIFGAGSDGLQTYGLIRSLSAFEVIGFSDNNASIHNNELIDGLVVYAPNDLYNKEFDWILIASTYHEEIKEGLRNDHIDLFEKVINEQDVKASLYMGQKIKFKKLLAEVRNKNRIRVVFFVIHQSTWKLDKLYQLMLSDDFFEPIVLICPDSANGGELMISDMTRCYEYFVMNGYNTVLAAQDGQWLDVNNKLRPDIIFFTNPHNITLPEYRITSFVDKLTCYYPYGYFTSNYSDNIPQFNSIFHNLLWLFFSVCKFNEKTSKEISANNGDNVRMVGYTFGETLLSNKKNSFIKNVKKKIVYAPHHTVKDDDPLALSTFIVNGKKMREISDIYKSNVDFYFKPHPLLKFRLYNHIDWGKEKTDEYYNSWGGNYISEDYIDLFYESDAMIHDCGSFLIEYMYLNKPMAYMIRDSDLENRFNEMGKMALGVVPHIHNHEDILYFIDSVISEKDEFKVKRDSFIKKFLMKEEYLNPSQNIIEVIKKEIYEA